MGPAEDRPDDCRDRGLAGLRSTAAMRPTSEWPDMGRGQSDRCDESFLAPAASVAADEYLSCAEAAVAALIATADRRLHQGGYTACGQVFCPHECSLAHQRSVSDEGLYHVPRGGNPPQWPAERAALPFSITCGGMQPSALGARNGVEDQAAEGEPVSTRNAQPLFLGRIGSPNGVHAFAA